MLRRQKAAAKKTDAAMRSGCRTTLQHHIARQIPRLRAEAVTRPRTRAGITDKGKAGVHEEVSLRMLTELRGHAADHAEIVRQRRHVRKQIAHRQPGLTVAIEGPMRRLN